MLDLVRLLAVLVGILVLLWRRWDLGLVLLLASAAIGLLFGRPILGLLRDGADTLADPTTLRLVGTVVLILVLGALLKSTAQLDGLVRALKALMPDGRVALAFIPALIGMLPMIGGAVFSAPMVEEVGNHMQVDRNRKTYVNYWFRHVWEWVLPVYPTFILVAALVNVTPRDLALSQWPFFVAAVAVGVPIGLWPIPRQTDPASSGLSRNGNLRLLIDSVWPIALVIVLSVVLNVDLILSLLATILLMLVIKRLGPRRTWDIFRQGVQLKLVLVIVSVMFFQQVLESTGAVDEIPNALTSAGVPKPIILFFLPMLPGLLTGLAPGAFGIAIPVVLPLLTASGVDMGSVALAYAGGFLGVLLSPMHLCFSLSREFFGADWGPVYRMLVPSVMVLAAVGALLYVVL
jgi:hypothetical protein